MIQGGTDPEISPDGTRIAYTDNYGEGRRIAVKDLTGDKTTIFKNLPSENAYGPTWSPDGQSLLFQILSGSHWGLALITVKDAAVTRLKIPGADEEDVFSPAWSVDGQTVFCQDLTDLFQVDLNGKIKARWRLSSLLPRADMNSNDRIQPAENSRFFFLDVQLDQDGPIEGWEGPPAAIVVVDIEAREVRQLTPPNLYGWGVWRLNDNEVLFTGTEDGQHFSIYQIALESNEAKKLVATGSNPSASRKVEAPSKALSGQ
ncbi:MAG: PD40 domain-containing protein [Verrucomicrobia bacterium]|nr:PD40 domain-containing protein [Verrucomicrobiota bacterium]